MHHPSPAGESCLPLGKFWGAFFLILLLQGCAAGRKTTASAPAAATERVPEPATVAVQTAAEPLPPPRENPLDLLIENAIKLFDEGEALFREGRFEEGRERFKESLHGLKHSEYDFFANPRLEKAYYSLLKDIQILEMQAMVDPVEMQLPPFEAAPLDELAELNPFTLEVDPHLRDLVSEDLLNTRFDIPVVLNDSVLRFLNYYQGRGREIMERGLRRSGKYLNLFREIFQREGLPLDLIYMAHVESLFNPRAYSRARAKGIWQFMKWTGLRLGLKQDWWVDERSDVIKSTEAAARYLKELHETFGDWHLVLAAYNVGPGRIERIISRYGPLDFWSMANRRMLPRETVNHVPSILAALLIFRNPGRYGFEVEPEPEVRFESVRVGYQVDLNVIAEQIETPVSQLQELNPELLRGITPDDGSHHLKVPPGKGELLSLRLAQLPPEKRLVLKHHRVRKGETLSHIARRYAVPVRAIAQANRIRNVHRLSVGQQLIVPLSGWKGGSPAVQASNPAPALPARYVVRRGDSLEKIARIYGVTVKDLLRWNHLDPRRFIYPGQRLEIRAEASGAEQ